MDPFDPVDDLPRRAFLHRSCGLFAAALLAANGATLAGCDTVASGTDVPTDTSGVTVDLARTPSLDAVGGGLLMSSTHVLVVHAGADDFRAFNSVCPHERNTISQVLPSGASYEIRCPTHGWTFDLAGQPTGRAQRPTARYAVVQTGQTLTITTS